MAKPLALTSGEPAGIGPDITIKAWLRRNELGLPAFYLLGDREFLGRRAKALGLTINLAEVRPEDATTAFAEALPVVATGHAATAQPGRPDAGSAEAAMASIRQAVVDVVAGRAGAVVTNPIPKSVLMDAGFPYPGHTEYLAELAARSGVPPGHDAGVARPRRRAGHRPCIAADVLAAADERAIVDAGRSWPRTAARFGIARPPGGSRAQSPCRRGRHARPRGPDNRRARGRELRATASTRAGPLSADTLFHAEARARLRRAMCMYHDQALIPIKTLDFDTAST